MATKTYEKTDRLADALQTLEQGILNLTSSDEWLRYLTMQSTFHNYSFGNVLLILAQREDASRIAGFQAWKKLGRSVNKGEKSIVILAPLTKRIELEDDQGEKKSTTRVFGYRAAHVFDIAQTSGEELPQVVKKLQGDDDGGLFERLKAFSESRGCLVTVEAIARSANGYFLPEENRIVVREGLSPVQAAKTLAHEVTHSILHRDPDEYMDHRSEHELEAESTAYVVMQHFGLDSSDYSFGYVCNWAGGGEEAIKSLRTSAQRIQQTAKAIIIGISEDLEEGEAFEL